MVDNNQDSFWDILCCFVIWKKYGHLPYEYIAFDYAYIDYTAFVISGKVGKSLCNRSYWWRFCVFTLFFGILAYGVCHRTESDLFPFLSEVKCNFVSSLSWPWSKPTIGLSGRDGASVPGRVTGAPHSSCGGASGVDDSHARVLEIRYDTQHVTTRYGVINL